MSCFPGEQEDEAAAKKRAEEEAAEAEYDKWRGAISMEAEGTVEQDAQEESQGLLGEFVEYIKVRGKRCPLSFPGYLGRGGIGNSLPVSLVGDMNRKSQATVGEVLWKNMKVGEQPTLPLSQLKEGRYWLG